jgi:hypothetical protein
MFNTKLVGTANAFAAGWGNMGGGFTSFIMPLIFDGIAASGVAVFHAWRWAFFVPASFQVLLTILTMVMAQDMPDGNMADLYSHGALKKPGGASVWKAAVFNYRTWVRPGGTRRARRPAFPSFWTACAPPAHAPGPLCLLAACPALPACRLRAAPSLTPAPASSNPRAHHDESSAPLPKTRR